MSNHLDGTKSTSVTELDTKALITDVAGEQRADGERHGVGEQVHARRGCWEELDYLEEHGEEVEHGERYPGQCKVDLKREDQLR